MNRESISYEQALDLKELGFDEPCFKGYTEEYKTLINFSNTHTNTSVKNALPTKSFTAPLYHQTFRWFREKHDLDSHVYRPNEKLKIWGYNTTLHVNVTPFKTYEEAELACLKKLIEIIKNK